MEIIHVTDLISLSYLHHC